MTWKTTLDEQDIAAFAPDEKVGLLATRTPEGLPHLSLITTLTAREPDTLMFGQFCEGRSKRHVQDDPRVGFLVMTQEREFWRGRATWTHQRREGDDYTAFNHRPMFRYNSYFGIHTVHYLDLEAVTAKARLNLGGVLAGALAAPVVAALSGKGRGAGALNHWSHQHLNGLATLRFLAYIGEDGYPAVLPVVPGRAASRDRLVFVASVFGQELTALPADTPVAVLALNLQMESVMVRGTLGGFRGLFGLKSSTLDVDYVYNSMPPKQGQIYPPLPLEAVTEF